MIIREATNISRTQRLRFRNCCAEGLGQAFVVTVIWCRSGADPIPGSGRRRAAAHITGQICGRADGHPDDTFVMHTHPRAALSLAVVCPMANEGAKAVAFVDAVLAACAGFRRRVFLAVVDHASSDNTRQLLEEHARFTTDLKVIWAPENRGVVDAYVRGYREALALDPDWILEIDAGFSHQPSDIPVLIAKMEQGYDCVFGSRFCPGGSISDSSRKRYWISWGGTVLTNLLLGTKLHDMTSGFQLFTREALQKIVDRGIESRGPFFQTEMKTYARRMKVTEVPIQYRAASHNVGSKQIKDAFKNLWRLVGMRIAGRV